MFIFRFIGPLLLLVLVYWVVQRFSKKHGLTTQQFKWLLGISVALVIVITLVALGRVPIQAIFAPLLFALTFALRNIHLLIRLFPLLQSLNRKVRSGKAANISSIRTKFLLMELQHETGEMDGEVLEGQFKEMRLSALTLEQLLLLAKEIRNDTDSIQILEAYLDRMHDQWRENATNEQHEKHRHASIEAPMTETLALEILGLERGAERKEIVAAHRKLMQRMHPDRGGSDYLAQKINAAKDFLLKE